MAATSARFTAICTTIRRVMLNSVGPPVSGERLASHCEYRPKVFATGTGIERAMRRVIGSAALIRYGVNSVVNAETATAIGYRKLLVTFSDNPSDAMMNENSPILIGSAALIRYGVNSVVNAETATAIGYRKLLVTFSDNPSDAMMNENSPICATLMPTRIDVRPSLPARKVPSPQDTILPNTTATVITAIGHQ